ncbi:hypothetical protein NliqN6_0207 [Naganishia liquefaciens]|uniref:Metallo-beta-lactamase domain-containing protein n=1 Tax=Naganishia liquefaciens TaxID=104408 RepID=A0A8H3TNV5_9TREE|nr:hypothetical protein NliqN6_0207 [Naganishia liquefaciens]
MLELIVLGSGPSGGLPQLGCLTRPSDAPYERCRCCESTREETADDIAAGGRKNQRGNTSCVVRKTWDDGTQSCVMIDCGKTFARDACEWFPKHGLRRIDAVILSHDHADGMSIHVSLHIQFTLVRAAILGLDDLRMFTRPKLKEGNDAIQDHLDVYCEAKTLAVIKERFPYLVSFDAVRGFTSVADMVFHVIEPGRQHVIAGIKILPLEVQHGFSVVSASDSLGVDLNVGPTRTEPYMTLAFLIEDDILWMTDASIIPRKTWDILHHGLDKEIKHPRRRLSLAFIDLSEIYPLRAHLSVRTFLEVVEKLFAVRTYAIGMNHTLCHGEIEALGEEVQGIRQKGREDAFLDQVLRGEEKIEDAPVWSSLKQKVPWFRPCYDGMAVRVEEQQQSE